MSVNIHVEMPNLAEMVGRLKAFRMDQLPYALSLGMNRAAKDAKDQFRGHMARQFSLRSESFPKSFGPFGLFGGGKSNVRVNEKGKILGKNSAARGPQAIANGWSHMSQWPNLRVVFGGLAYASALQEEGGSKPFQGAKSGVPGGSAQGTKPSKATASRVWIPTRHLPRDGSKIAQAFQPARIRKRLVAKRRGSKATNSVWLAGNRVMLRDDGSRDAFPIYLVHQRVQVPPRLDLAGLVLRTYNAKLWPRFSEAMDSALKAGPKKSKK